MANFISLGKRVLSYLVLAGIGVIVVLVGGCSYQWNHSDRSLPGGYRQVYVPIFKNYSAEPGVEIDFTNAIRQEFERSRVARVSDGAHSEAILVGEIMSLTYIPQAPIKGSLAPLGGNSASTYLPMGTVLATSYEIRLSIRMTLKRISDGGVLWTSEFSGSRSYLTPQVTVATVNTINSSYNLSARRQNIQILSTSMMAEAHDRMLENF